MTMATGVDLITTRGSNLTSPTVMLASTNNSQITNTTQIEKNPVQKSSNRASNKRKKKKKTKNKRGNEKSNRK